MGILEIRNQYPNLPVPWGAAEETWKICRGGMYGGDDILNKSFLAPSQQTLQLHKIIGPPGHEAKDISGTTSVDHMSLVLV